MKRFTYIFCIALFFFGCDATFSSVISLAGELEDLQEQVRRNPNDADAHFVLGVIYSGLGQYHEAIASLKEAIRIKPDDRLSFYYLKLVYIKFSKHKEAISFFKEAIRVNPKNASAHIILGSVYASLGQYQEAIALFKEAIRVNPGNANTHVGVGSEYASLGQHKEAIAFFKEAIRIEPDHSAPHSSLGISYNNLGRYQEAIASFKEAIRLDPNNAIAYANLGISYNNLGRYQEAIASFKEAIRLKPDNAIAYANLGDSYYNLGRYKEALAPLKKAIRLDPNNAIAYAYLGGSHSQLGHYQEAIASYKDAIRLNPEDVYSLSNLGDSYYNLGRYKEALAPLKKAIRLDPNYAFAHFKLGDSYYSLGRYQEAIASFKEAIKIKPNYAFAYGGLGDAHSQLAHYQEARASYKKANVLFREVIRLNPDDFFAHTNLGSNYNALGKYQEAIASFKEVLRLKPDDTRTHIDLGLAHQNLGQFQKAIAFYKEAIRLKPEDFEAKIGLGSVYLVQGKLNTALIGLTEADKIKPNDPEILSYLGMIYWELDNLQKAKEVLELALRNNPEPPSLNSQILNAQIYGNLSEVYEKLERYDDAIKTARKALEINYDHPFPNFILGLSYDAKSDGLNAISHMKTAAKGFQKSQNVYREQERWSQRNDQKYKAKSKKKLREFYSKYGYRPEDFQEVDIASPPTSQPTPHKEQTPQSGTGSGFFVSKMGHVITNAHVVKGCKKLTVGDNANKQVPAEVINTDRSNDLALLKLSSLDMASAESKSLIQKLSIVVVPLSSKGLLRSEDVRLGEKVLVAGYPFGDIFSNTIKVTSGIVSATRGAGDDTGQFQLDAAIQPGNSGGPIYDSSGNIVGVVVAQLDKLKMAKAIGSMPENVNFGIKASTVKQFLISSGLPSKKAEQANEKSTEQLAEIAQNQALMVTCLNDQIIRPSEREQVASIPPSFSTEPRLEQLQKRDAKRKKFKVDPIKSIREMNALGRYQEAVDMAEKVAKEFPEHAKLHTWWGISLVKLKKKQEAIDHFVIAAKNDPADEKAHLYWGLTLSMDKNFEEAITHYRTVLEINPKHGNAYAYWGASLNALGKFGEALTKIDESLSLDPLNNTAHALRIDILYNLKRYKEAWQAVHKAQAAKIVVSKGSLDRLAKAFPDDFKGEGNLGVMFPLDPLIVNLAGSGGKRFLKIAISLELSTPDVHAEIKENIQKITDSILVLLSSKSFDDVYSVQGKFKLKDEITSRVNRLLMEKNVRDTYFTEFIIQ